MPGSRLLIMGRNGFLARHLMNALPPRTFLAAGHDALDRADLVDDTRTVISCMLDPTLGRDGYDLDQDPDVRLARRIEDRPIRYLMLSSRKVYAPCDIPLKEADPTGPLDPYGRNKLAVERRLRDLLGERLTILRLANIFGYERDRRTFLGLLLDRLAGEGSIHYDMSPFVRRDFLPVERAAALLAKLVQDPPGGVLNLGSGIGLPVGRLALWILEGYGRGCLVIEQPREHDAFTLDVAQLQAHVGPVIQTDQLEAACRRIGQRLAKDVRG